ncbi:cytidylate kinase [Treponema pallidum subsp. pallidum str. Sea 81-4]|nr:cytidylate kinase, putative [Treponema pallidum subsp. pallidum str. Chicago]AHN67025.1 cytidylate kinase [Treponema pallidum subsp. pallidum str. Sea 81-4]
MSGNKAVRIAVSGASGCGNTTVSALLAERLGLPLVNYTFRNIARELGISLSEVLERARTDNHFDKAVDARQLCLAMRSSCVVGSRLAIWLVKDAALKVYLLASLKERVKRVLQREGGDVQDVERFTSMRDAEDMSRYKKLYRIDNTNYSFADLVLNTEGCDQETVVSIIIEMLRARGIAW